MHSFHSPFLQELQARGLIHQCTNFEALDRLFASQPISLYSGFDATASSLHVGNLMAIMVLRIAQRHGHKPIVLMGGGTTKVGDPSGKDSARPFLETAHIDRNIESIQKSFEKYVAFGKDCSEAFLVNNDIWLSSLNYLEFLAHYGRHFSINRMLTFESVKIRLEREQPLTFLEFNYMILQAYDFLELNRHHKCVLQIGGSDQWGNIVNGVDLVRRVSQKEAFGLTYPLLMTTSGQKMGKSEKGAVWLNADALSPFDYWQFWRNVEDSDVIRFLKIYTDLSVPEINSYEAKGEDWNKLKILLADEATKLAHGAEVLPSIHETVNQVFKGASEELEVVGYDPHGNAVLKTALPVIQLKESDLEKGMLAFDLILHAQLVNSKGEARRLIRGGGCSLNGEKIKDENQLITLKDQQALGIMRLSVGKKHHTLVHIIKG